MIYDNIVRKNSLIDKYRLQSIHSLSKMVNNLEGDVVEVGVYKGGSGRFLCQHFPNNLIYLIDTFEGLPQESVHDNFHKKGDFTSMKCLQEKKQTTVFQICRKLQNNNNTP